MNTLYKHLLKPILFKMRPDVVHDLFTLVGEAAGRFRVSRWLFGVIYNYPSGNGPAHMPFAAFGGRGADISKTVDGITYRTPVLLSAGFDPDGRLTQILPMLAFGGEEVGSVTAHPCAGNPRPHLTRLVRNKSIVVYKGLRNRGVDALIARLKRTPRLPTGRQGQKFVLGISIARTNMQASATDVEAGISDYVASFKKLNEANVGDYYTLNISCPNAFTGETFINPEHLAKLLPRIREVACTKPVYLKMPINVSWEHFAQLLDIADKNAIQGVVIGNLNKDYSHLQHPEDAPKEYRGGLSGLPTRELSNALIKQTRAKYGKRFTIVGVGGILTPEDAMEKFAAGADLVQLISGMIFEGPGLIRAICERYAKEATA